MFRKVGHAYQLLDLSAGARSSRSSSQYQYSDPGRDSFHQSSSYRRARSQRAYEEFQRRKYEEARFKQEQQQQFHRVWQQFILHMKGFLSKQWKNFASLKEGEFKYIPLLLGTVPVALLMWLFYEYREEWSDDTRAIEYYTQFQIFSNQAQKVFQKISARCDNAPYPTLLHDYQRHVLSYRQISPKILHKRDVVLIDKLFMKFPVYAAELLDNPAVRHVAPLTSPYIVGLKSENDSTKNDINLQKLTEGEELPIFRMFAEFGMHDLEQLVHIYNSEQADRALFFINNPSILRQSSNLQVTNQAVAKWLTRDDDFSSYLTYINSAMRNNEGKMSIDQVMATISDQFVNVLCIKTLYPLLVVSIMRNTRRYGISLYALQLYIAVLLYDPEIKKIDKICNGIGLYSFYLYICYVHHYHFKILKAFSLR